MCAMETAQGTARSEPRFDLSVPRPPWRRAVGRTLRWGNTLRWRIFPPDYDRTYVLRDLGLEITVLPSVFHPSWHFTSSFLASTCEQLIQGETLSVLEVGTGTGLVAMSAARHAGRVVATDLNALSVRCARMNVLNNGLGGRVEVYEGDMFAPVTGERFDLIICNPPYFRGEPRNSAELAYMAGDDLQWISRFARSAREHITEGGSVACIFGDAADISGLVTLFEVEGWGGSLVARREMLVEELQIWQFRPRAVWK
jgi:release factor glutamine methyltransferase